jgi:hypothetical protein
VGRSTLVGLTGLLLSACSSTRCPETSCGEPVRHFVVLRATPVADPSDGTPQVFVDSRVVTVPGTGRIRALDEAAGVEAATTPVWLAGTEIPVASFGERARLVAAPKILALDGQDATVLVGENAADGSLRDGWHLEVTPTIRSEQVHLTVAYRHHEAGRLVDSVPSTPLEATAGRVFILESLPTR